MVTLSCLEAVSLLPMITAVMSLNESFLSQGIYLDCASSHFLISFRALILARRESRSKIVRWSQSESYWLREIR